MDLLQKKLLGLLPGLLHNFPDLIRLKSGTYLKELNTWKSNGY
jgi:hypothetical protein